MAGRLVDLWHYTCDHSHAKIDGLLLPAAALAPRQRMPWTGRVVWLTDMTEPSRDALGLSMEVIECDRTVYRYRVTDATTCVPYTRWAREFLYPLQREMVESVPGARPMHWWVSEHPVPVAYDPVTRAP